MGGEFLAHFPRVFSRTHTAGYNLGLGLSTFSYSFFRSLKCLFLTFSLVFFSFFAFFSSFLVFSLLIFSSTPLALSSFFFNFFAVFSLVFFSSMAFAAFSVAFVLPSLACFSISFLNFFSFP